MTEKPLGYQPRDDHDDQRDRDDNSYIRSQGSTQLVPGIDQSYRGRYKQQRHNEDQKIRYFFHIIHLQDFLFQQKKQQQNTVNAGRNRKWNQRVQHFADERQRNNNSKLFKQFQGEQLRSYYTFQVVPFYHNIGKISMFVSICLADFADKITPKIHGNAFWELLTFFPNFARK